MVKINGKIMSARAFYKQESELNKPKEKIIKKKKGKFISKPHNLALAIRDAHKIKVDRGINTQKSKSVSQKLTNGHKKHKKKLISSRKNENLITESLGENDVKRKSSDNVFPVNGEKINFLSKSLNYRVYKEPKKIKLAKETRNEKLQNRGYETFCWILESFNVEEFFAKHWEKKPLLIKRNVPSFYEGIFSTEALDKILRNQCVMFTKNIDVTSYKEGKRLTHNPEERAHAPLVWNFYNDGCSVRFLNPQTFHRPVWQILSYLQEFFCSFCGANVYLTPPDSQGFAPHWDDIEAFILQLEGKKRWRVYQPRELAETLPRESSINFGPEDELGEPVIDCILEAGDLLYFPRGFIHQGHTVEEEHSLHITISTYQKTAWVDLFEKLLPAALSNLAEDDVEFRTGLPLGYINHLGIIHSESQSQARDAFLQKAKKLLNRLFENAPWDSAVDQMAKQFTHDALPPVLSKTEKMSSIHLGGEAWCPDKKRVTNRVELSPDTEIRLIAPNCVRLVAEENMIKVFYSVENSREYHAEELRYLEVEPDMAPGIEELIYKYPLYMQVESFPFQDLQLKLDLANSLWEKGIVRTKYSLPNAYEEDD